uniref:Uncharacterized protein n=1 Tax=Caenorhabditis tropicalis TaxID=1561998 RepID=A0A1I7THX3_9PELO
MVGPGSWESDGRAPFFDQEVRKTKVRSKLNWVSDRNKHSDLETGAILTMMDSSTSDPPGTYLFPAPVDS